MNLGLFCAHLGGVVPPQSLRRYPVYVIDCDGNRLTVADVKVTDDGVQLILE